MSDALSSFSITQVSMFPIAQQSDSLLLVVFQEEVLGQHRGDAGRVRHHSPQGGAADGAQRAVPTCAPDGLEHMCLHYSGHRYSKTQLSVSHCPSSSVCNSQNVFACLHRKHIAGRGQATLRVPTKQTGWMTQLSHSRSNA